METFIFIVLVIGAAYGMYKLIDLYASEKCPNCGTELEYNSYDKAECPNCGYYKK